MERRIQLLTLIYHLLDPLSVVNIYILYILSNYNILFYQILKTLYDS